MLSRPTAVTRAHGCWTPNVERLIPSCESYVFVKTWVSQNLWREETSPESPITWLNRLTWAHESAGGDGSDHWICGLLMENQQGGNSKILLACELTLLFSTMRSNRQASWLATAWVLIPIKEDKRPATGKAFAWRVNQNLIKPDFSPGNTASTKLIRSPCYCGSIAPGPLDSLEILRVRGKELVPFSLVTRVPKPLTA